MGVISMPDGGIGGSGVDGSFLDELSSEQLAVITLTIVMIREKSRFID